jgi:hypothetical protein
MQTKGVGEKRNETCLGSGQNTNLAIEPLVVIVVVVVVVAVVVAVVVNVSHKQELYRI